MPDRAESIKTETPGHTPGPWTCERQHDNHDADIRYIDVMTVDEDSLIGRTEVAVIYLSDQKSGGADARLIAAAPDLLAACRRYVELDDGWRAGKHVNPADRATLDFQIRDALAKAEGGAA